MLRGSYLELYVYIVPLLINLPERMHHTLLYKLAKPSSTIVLLIYSQLQCRKLMQQCICCIHTASRSCRANRAMYKIIQIEGIEDILCVVALLMMCPSITLSGQNIYYSILMQHLVTFIALMNICKGSKCKGWHSNISCTPTFILDQVFNLLNICFDILG